MNAPEDFRDKIRDAVLAGLDTAAVELDVPRGLGTLDRDLPELFRAVDAQADRLWQRIVDRTNERYREETLAILEGRATPLSARPS